VKFPLDRVSSCSGTDLICEVGDVELTPQIYDLAEKHFTDRKVGTASVLVVRRSA
jgi:hypothetical protein